jgi:hypothetical protein
LPAHPILPRTFYLDLRGRMAVSASCPPTTRTSSGSAFYFLLMVVQIREAISRQVGVILADMYQADLDRRVRHAGRTTMGPNITQARSSEENPDQLKLAICKNCIFISAQKFCLPIFFNFF